MFTPSELQTLNAAKAILLDKLRQPGTALNSPAAVIDYLRLQMTVLEREVFAVIYLDNQHRVIEYREEFQGTINTASVYPREIVKAALRLNAGAAIFAHNHPSGIAEPSQADILITERLRDALGLIEVRALDHIIIGGADYVSFAERGLI